ncbi:MAG: heparan-alpha-glucosaminide N-acetyltransferase domain-containing protein [Myxococcales bacterium]|nr:heparan-alpha-glucosaminide N-acetyltransferase domain-containing protein [Myxococcales bacterium]
MTAVQRATGRFDALDTLRCLAVLVMVQGHAFYLVIEDAVRGERWYAWHNYLHGYTAPAFLFGAGLAFGVTTLRNLPAHSRWGSTLFSRLYRYLALFAIGYAIQLPPLDRDPASWTMENLRVFSRVEALQHIGAVLLFCQLLVVVTRRRAPFLVAATVAGVSIVLVGPWMSRLPDSALGPQGVAAYLSADVGSTFPLVPWAGFVLLGITAASLLPRTALDGPNWRIAGAFVATGLAAVLLSLGLDRLAPDAFGEHFYWKASPYFFLRRLGWVLVMLGGFAGIDWAFFRRKATAGPVRRWIRLVSQQSLVAYVAHLALLYGSPFSAGLGRDYGHRLGVTAASLLVLGMCVLLTALAYAWRQLDRHWDGPFLFVRRTGVAVMATLVVAAGLQAGTRVTDVPLAGAAPSAPVASGLSETVAGPVTEGSAEASGSPPAAPTDRVVPIAPIVVETRAPGADGLAPGVEVATPAAGTSSVTAAALLR